MNRYTTEGFSNKIHLAHMFITYRVTRAQRSRHGLPAAYESDWKISSAARTMALLCESIKKTKNNILCIKGAMLRMIAF